MRRLVLVLLAALVVLGGCDVTLARRLLMAGSGSGSFLLPRVPPTDASWSRSGSNPILTASVAWEQTAVVENVVIYEAGAWKMWYRGGWSTQAMGYATSSDGIAWTKYASNPIYGQGGAGMAGNDGGQPFVTKIGATYWLYATNNDVPRVNVATSSDGIAWTTQSSSISFPVGGSLWGNRVVWVEGATWHMLQEVYVGATWQIYSYTSSDGLAWSIANSGSALSTLQVHAGGAYGAPRFARDASGVLTPRFGGVYHLWYHAVNGTGTLPTDIYTATSSDLVTWTIGNGSSPVLTHSGSGFEVDQVAGPAPVTVAGTAYLFYDGDDNATDTAHILLATAPGVLP